MMLVLCAVLGYLLGCIPTGAAIARFYAKTDIRKTGSGNTGTTNVLRTLGWLPSVLTLLGDALKGVAAALIGRGLGGEAGMLLASLFVVLGHDFPVFTRFKGGKGIATSLGVTIVICPPVAPFLVLIVFATVALTRMMSLGSLIASVAYPLLHLAFMPEGANRLWRMLFAVALSLLSFFCHRTNILRLIRGEENRLDFGRIGKVSELHFRGFLSRMKKKN